MHYFKCIGSKYNSFYLQILRYSYTNFNHKTGLLHCRLETILNQNVLDILKVECLVNLSKEPVFLVLQVGVTS